MSEGKPQQAADEEPFLERWSRRKSRARQDVATQPADAAPAPDQVTAIDPAAEESPLPDIESLDEGSDYSAFLSPRVDEILRRQALRKLFHSPKYNVCDGLDDYCGDFTQFEALGDLLTADLRHQMERAAQAAERLAQETGAPPAPQTALPASTRAGGDAAPATDAKEADDDPVAPA